MNLTFSKSTVIRRKDDDLLASPLADELVMMNVQTGDYLGLNKVATDIWNLIEKPVTLQHVCIQLLDKYDIDQATCEEQTVMLVQQLLDNKLIEVQNA